LGFLGRLVYRIIIFISLNKLLSVVSFSIFGIKFLN
jgi:hypothetical protein